MRVLFLDVDGVLNRAGFQPAESVGLRSWIEPELARRLDQLVRATRADLVMSSDWRIDRGLDELRAELAATGIEAPLIGATPELAGQPRWREIEAWMVEHRVAREAVVIVDDLHDMGKLAARFVRTSPLNGLDEQAAMAVAALFDPPADR